MIDVSLLRNEPEKVKKGIAAKKADPALVDTFLELDGKWRKCVAELDALRAKQNELSKKREVEAAKSNKEEIKKKEEEAATLEKEREEVWGQIPNLPSDDTPIGKSEEDNKVIRSWGKTPKFDFEPLDHLALGEKLGFIDVAHASAVAGTRFAYLKGDAVRLEFALVQFTLETLTDEAKLAAIAKKAGVDASAKPFVPVVPPVMVRPDVLRKMARLEPVDDRFYLPKDDLFLAGSAEHTLGPLHMDDVIREELLPVRYLGFSTSFRRESGSYGKDTRGIIRVHQFDKLEMESFTAPEHSFAEHDFFVAIQEHLMQQLEIPYQVVAVCTGDMGGPDTKQTDIEAWMPGQGKYRETHTADLMTDYQARRLGTKVRRPDGKTEFAHMNDATAFAIGRTLVAIFENYQTKEGAIRVPKVLQKYIGKEIIGKEVIT